MVSILLATHGKFAEGIFMSGNMIFGEQENVSAVILLPSEGPDDLCAKMEKAISEFDDQEQVLILVDLWGGTPFNQANRLIAGHEDNWAIVAGLNLPMLVAAYAARDDYETAHELAQAIIPEGKTGIRVFPKILSPLKKAALLLQQAPRLPQAPSRPEPFSATATSRSNMPVSIPDFCTDRSQPTGPRRSLPSVSLSFPIMSPMTLCVSR